MKPKNNAIIRRLTIIILFATIITNSFAQSKQSREDFYNLINIKNIPLNEKDRDQNVFSDLGSWIGFALPEKETKFYNGAFIGPYIMTGKCWISKTLADPYIHVDGEKFDLLRNVQTAKYFPGKLEQYFKNQKISFTTELCYASSSSTVTRGYIKNICNSEVTVSLGWNGGVYNNSAKLEKDKNKIRITLNDGNGLLTIHYLTAQEVALKGCDSISVVEKERIVLAPGQGFECAITQTFAFSFDELYNNEKGISTLQVSETFKENKLRWDGYLSKLFSSKSKFVKEDKYRWVIVKSLITLVSNWRSPAGDILHDGTYPSYSGFFGIWAWDSWKHASANALYNPEQAKNEVRALFDYQDEAGMLPDFISINKKRNNWRDTKPPLSAWAVKNIYAATGDKTFVEEMFEKVYKYHRWWYSHRDNDGNGVCEYGSTDGTLLAACWESGMDNGVRFDDAVMLKNKPEKSWSMNQENICLNSFLYKEKKELAELALVIGKKELAAQLTTEAEALKHHIQTKMFDEETGFFYDTRIGTGEFVKVMGAECWVPLWAGVATKKQAAKVLEKMLDTNKFNTMVPLGTLDISHPALRPTRGYWRGPVWIDQVYFGITGLRNYGFHKEADMFTNKYIQNAQGLLTDGPIHENYNPITGETLNCPNFSWSSALTIKMLLMN